MMYFSQSLLLFWPLSSLQCVFEMHLTSACSSTFFYNSHQVDLLIIKMCPTIHWTWLCARLCPMLMFYLWSLLWLGHTLPGGDGYLHFQMRKLRLGEFKWLVQLVTPELKSSPITPDPLPLGLPGKLLHVDVTCSLPIADVLHLIV